MRNSVIILAAALPLAVPVGASPPGLCHLRSTYSIPYAGLRWCEYGCENGKRWNTSVPIRERCKPTAGD